MKKNLFIIFFVVQVIFIQAQSSTHTGNIIVNTQAEVNAATSLSTHTKDSLFKFYPNPSEGLLILQVNPTHIPSQLLIYNLVGNPMADYEITTMKKVIDVSDFSPGIYLMILQIDHIRQIIVKRLLKE